MFDKADDELIKRLIEEAEAIIEEELQKNYIKKITPLAQKIRKKLPIQIILMMFKSLYQKNHEKEPRNLTMPQVSL